MKDPLSKDGPSTSPAWVARKEACEGAIKKLKRISGKTMPQKAAVAFLRNYIEGCNGFIENKMPASGNRKFGITDNAIVAGAGVLGLEVVKEPIFRMRYPPEVFTLVFDDPEKRLDLLVHRKGERNRYVAIECKSTSDIQ